MADQPMDTRCEPFREAVNGMAMCEAAAMRAESRAAMDRTPTSTATPGEW